MSFTDCILKIIAQTLGILIGYFLIIMFLTGCWFWSVYFDLIPV